MSCIFIGYRGHDRSFVREIEQDLKRNGLKYELKHDIEEGDLRPLGYNEVWRQVKGKLAHCQAMILLVGDTTHSPRQTLEREINYAISKNWYIFGIRLPNRHGSPPSEVREYEKYEELDNNPAHMVSIITQKLHT